MMERVVRVRVVFDPSIDEDIIGISIVYIYLTFEAVSICSVYIVPKVFQRKTNSWSTTFIDMFMYFWFDIILMSLDYT